VFEAAGKLVVASADGVDELTLLVSNGIDVEGILDKLKVMFGIRELEVGE
jgi:hypothetical protein